MSTANRVLKNTMFLYIRMLVSIVVSFLTTRILLQSLGASDYGIYNVVAGALAMLGFLSASMSSTTQRFISYAEGEGKFEKIKEIFNNAVFIHNMTALLVCLFFVVAGFFFFNGILNIPLERRFVAIVVYGCMIITTVYAITIVPYDAVLNAHENMKYYSILGIADVITKFVIALCVMFCDSLDKLLLYGVLMALEAQLYRMVTKYYCTTHYKEVRDVSFRKYVNKATLRTMTSFAGWNMLNISTGMISLYGMNISVNHFFGTVVNASMGIATQVIGVLMGVSGNMIKAMAPVLVKSEGKQDHEKMIRISLIGSKYSYLLFSFFCIPIIFSIHPLLIIWLKDVPKWTELFCVLFLISTLLEQLYVFLYQSINAQGNVKNYNVVCSVANILPILVMCIEFSYGLPPYHAILDWIIFKVLCGGIITVYFARKNFNFPIRKFLRNILTSCMVPSILIAMIFLALKPGNDETMILTFLRLALMFLCSIPIYWIFSLDKFEKQYFFSLLKQRFLK